uniref:Reverse transcriptase Ty1/copia-type domain-containing protein n=1 Tax=Solanum lycopersicum TaxID=4081 RepID=A0A3Q7HR22_SOLLC
MEIEDGSTDETHGRTGGVVSRGEHVKSNCYQLIGYPADFKSKKKVNAAIGGKVCDDQIVTQDQLMQLMKKATPEQMTQMLNVLNMNTTNQPHRSAHMAGKVQLPTGESASISHIGSVHLNEEGMHFLDLGGTEMNGECETPTTTTTEHSNGKPSHSEVTSSPPSCMLEEEHVEEEHVTDVHDQVVLRKSHRTVRPPIWQADYVLPRKATRNCLYSIGDVVDYNSISVPYKRNDHQLILETKTMLKDTFKIKDLGDLMHFLGIEFARNKDGIIMHQRKYCLELISDMGLSGSKPIRAPIELNQKLTSAEFDLYFPQESKTDKLLKDPSVYQ